MACYEEIEVEELEEYAPTSEEERAWLEILMEERNKYL